MKKVHLTREQRYTIAALYKQGCTQKKIAETIGKDKSVVCRELKRNANAKLYTHKKWQICARNA
ncbi:MAG: helix-turn-helix domain-containing protein [Bacteroidales bacterium]|nr:helix-turn-helix domain-containing protein [Bacteroidales bacterium]